MNNRRRFATAESMERAIEQYFLELEYINDQGEVVANRKPSQSGLARFLGFSSLAAFNAYENYDSGDYQWVIDSAKLRLGEVLEELIMNGKQGAVFLLKNLDKKHWKDRTEQAVEVEDKRLGWSPQERLNRAVQIMEASRDAKAITEDTSWM